MQKEAVTKPWSSYVDESLNVKGIGVEMLLISPSDELIEQVLSFSFEASNNEAEYEALIARLELAHKFKAISLLIFTNSQLAVNQINGTYVARL